MIPLHRCVCIWTTFLVCLLLSSWCGFGSIRLSVRVGTYLGQLWMTLDNNNNNNNIHSMVVGDVGSSGSRYVNVRRDLPGLCFCTFFFLPNIRIRVVGVSRKFIQSSITCD